MSSSSSDAAKLAASLKPTTPTPQQQQQQYKKAVDLFGRHVHLQTATALLQTVASTSSDDEGVALARALHHHAKEADAMHLFALALKKKRFRHWWTIVDSSHLRRCLEEAVADDSAEAVAAALRNVTLSVDERTHLAATAVVDRKFAAWKALTTGKALNIVDAEYTKVALVASVPRDVLNDTMMRVAVAVRERQLDKQAAIDLIRQCQPTPHDTVVDREYITQLTFDTLGQIAALPNDGGDGKKKAPPSSSSSTNDDDDDDDDEPVRKRRATTMFSPRTRDSRRQVQQKKAPPPPSDDEEETSSSTDDDNPAPVYAAREALLRRHFEENKTRSEALTMKEVFTLLNAIDDDLFHNYNSTHAAIGTLIGNVFGSRVRLGDEKPRKYCIQLKKNGLTKTKAK